MYKKALYFKTRRSSGFTLIELMIVVAIVGVLAAIAQASYRQHIVDSRRAEAKAALNEVVVLMERRYIERGAYDIDVNRNPPPNLDALLPTGYRNVPDGSSAADRKYLISLAAATANTFTLTATAQNDQVQDACGNLSITQANVQTCSGYADNAECISECWQD